MSLVEQKRQTSQHELNEVIDYWLNLGRSEYYQEGSLIKFLYIFTPEQIRGAMYLACAQGRGNYFRYLCGVLHKWRKDLEEGREPQYFLLDE